VRWSVSEPYINLWLSDAPVSYTTSLGETIQFQVHYKQRETLHPGTNIFQPWYKRNKTYLSAEPPPPPPPYVPTTGWNHNWFSYIRFTGEYFLPYEHGDNTNTIIDFQS